MSDWSIPQQAKLKYTQLFNLHDRSRSGFLSGLQCRDILMQSGLPRNILAEIWNLSDIDGDGQLTREEFILAMHLTNQVRAGQTLPQELPADLVPPSYRRTRSISATSVHSTASATSSASSGVAMATSAATGSIVSPATIPDDSLSRKSSEMVSATGTIGSMLNSNSFEDKRRENFEKGRAELERRRLKMIEQQSSVISEQLVKCKKQVADAKSKIDSMRSERDTKAGLITSLEAQLKTVRDRKAFLDHEELQIIAMARDLNLVNSSHSAELDQQATKAKQEGINQMKEKLFDMEKEKEANMKQLADAQAKLEESKKELQSLSGEATKVYENYKEKIANAKVLREQFIAESKTKPIDLDSAWDSAPSQPVNHDAFSMETQKSAFPITTNEDPWASADPFASSKPTTFDDPFATIKNDSATPTNDLPGFGGSNNNNNDSNFEPARDYSSLSNMSSKSNEQFQGHTGAMSNSFSETTTSMPTEASARKKMYRALYDFEARNPDELTIKPGDIIVGSEVVCEPGWLSGELNGASGLFPEPFVEPLPDAEYPAAPLEAQPIQQQQQTTIPDTATSTASITASTTNAIVKYKVIYAYQALNPDELTINPGDIITGIESPTEPGWLMGELNEQRGLFPEAFVERFAEASVDPASSGPGKSRAKKAEVATVIANYRALGQEQLNLEKGQLVLIRRKMESGWWEGELQIKDNKQLSNGHRRPQPASLGSELDHLINELVDSELDYVNDLRLCQSAYIRPLSGSFDMSQIFANWSKLIDRHERVLKSIHDKSNGAAGESHSSLDYTFVLDKFQHLLSTIPDLYVDFCSRQNESARQLETKIASDIRFRQLVSDSQRKLRKLIERQQQQLEQGDQEQNGGQDISRALRNSNLPLTTFLLKPMQRITKYGLLFDRMLKALIDADEGDTESREIPVKLSAHDSMALRKRVEILKISAQSLCSQVNETCREKEDDEDNVRRLRWCQNHIKQQVHQLTGDGLTKPGASSGGGLAARGNSPLSSVDMRQLSNDFISINGRPISLSESLTSSNSMTFVPVEQIVFNSNTNCMGPRRLLKTGSMIKPRSGRELMLFLFNDLLLLTQIKSGGSQRAEDLFRSERAQQAYYKFYKQPIMLEDIQLDNYDKEHELAQMQTNSLVCPSLNSHSSAASSLRDQENVLVGFLDRHSCATHSLLAMSVKEKTEWDRLLGEHVARAKETRAAVQMSSRRAQRPLSVSDCMGRLFVTVLELTRVSSTNGGAKLHRGISQADLSPSSWDRRLSSAGQLADPVQNLSVRLQLKLYKRTQMILDDNEKREVIPTSDEFKTKPIAVSNSTRQPVMVDMNESMSNLDLQRDVFKFDNDSTQFLLAANNYPDQPVNNSNETEYLEIELIDDSRFRETQQLGRKRVSLDQLLGRASDLQPSRLEDSPLTRKLSTRSIRGGQILHPNRPIEMTFKLKSVSDPRSHQPNGSPMVGRPTDTEPHKYSVKLKLHLQLFCDINNLI